MSYLIIFIVIAIIAAVAILLMGSSKVQDTTTEFEAPSSEIGTPISVLFGKRAIKSPFIMWYGDVKIVKEDRETGGKK